MPIHCDDCGEKIDSLDEGYDEDGEVLCEECYTSRNEEDEDDGSDDEIVLRFCCDGDCKHVLRECARCTYKVPECALIDRQELGEVCPYCAHAHELSIFTPPDHVASGCAICLNTCS